MNARLARSMTIAVVVPVGLALAGATPGLAQMIGGGSGPDSIQSAIQHNLKGAQQPTPAQAAPPVVPGTKPPSQAAEPSPTVVNLSPTDALFDAINRGDLAAAREAVNRGADLDARNLLGLTPLDLSVDLGRNDISFALLSMRREYGSSAGSSERPSGTAAADQQVAPLRAAARPRVVRASANVEDDGPPPRETPRLFSGNGGAPIPAAGFLGFDEARPGR